MDWTERFARRTSTMKKSAIRELLKVGNRPGMISLAGGLPAPELFPIAEVEAATQRVLREHGRKALQYGETEGLAALRDWLAEKFSTATVKLKRTNVLITTGAQQGLDLLGRVLLQDGDKVIVENPTYLTTLMAWRPWGVDFLSAPTDAEGMRVDELRPLLAQKPKVIYAQPNFQNPSGITLSAARRKKLVELARETNTPVVEDNPYGELWYDQEPLTSLFELDASSNRDGALQSNIVYLGTFSKVLAPALRVGWTIADEALIDKLALAKQAADLQSSTFNQYIALEMVQRGLDVAKLRSVYRERRDAMLEALKKHFPTGASWNRPAGGLFVWVTLPQRIDAMALLPKAVENNVTFVPGEDFHADHTGKNTIRLNFSNAGIDDIHAGIERLGSVIKQALH
ncbi:MAG TPA: PLP-dependent aminotransferase family protein [Verrucomicrobiae bacterium]|nr:PLP-dependent aminotransferase family protein [Verrucomicrobiae bacterium]